MPALANSERGFASPHNLHFLFSMQYYMQEERIFEPFILGSKVPCRILLDTAWQHFTSFQGN